MSGFDGDFDLLPIRSALDSRPVPEFPTSEDFESASTACAHADPFTWRGAATYWRLEAVRERRLTPGVKLDSEALKAIALRTAARLFKAQGKELEA